MLICLSRQQAGNPLTSGSYRVGSRAARFGCFSSPSIKIARKIGTKQRIIEKLENSNIRQDFTWDEKIAASSKSLKIPR
jgi:hypothetical protein